MRQSEAKDLRSFLEEPVEEIVVEGAEGRLINSQQAEKVGALDEVGARFIAPPPPAPFMGEGEDRAMTVDPHVRARFTSPLHDISEPLYEVGARFTSPSSPMYGRGSTSPLHGAGVRFTTPWEGTGGQLHEVGARFTSPLEPPLGTSLPDDFTLRQTMPIASIPKADEVRARLTPMYGRGSTSPSHAAASPSSHEVRARLTPMYGRGSTSPYRLQRYQSRGVPIALSRSASGVLSLHPAGDNEQRVTADLAPAPHKIVPGEPSPALQSWERRRSDMYVWLVLLLLFLLVILGGIGLDSLIASYR